MKLIWHNLGYEYDNHAEFYSAHSGIRRRIHGREDPGARGPARDLGPASRQLPLRLLLPLRRPLVRLQREEAAPGAALRRKHPLLPRLHPQLLLLL